ncbi:hypothetical protein HAX54_037003, partial [Datura stramonium]|nr:hypothetical protein [Datura stramonium]
PRPPLVEIVRFGAHPLTVLKRIYKGEPRPLLVEIVLFGAHPLTVLKRIYKGEVLSVLAEVCPTTGFDTTVTAQTTACRNCPLWGSPPHGFKTRLQGRGVTYRRPWLPPCRDSASSLRFAPSPARHRL